MSTWKLSCRLGILWRVGLAHLLENVHCLGLKPWVSSVKSCLKINTLGKENTCKNTISYESSPACGSSSLLVKESGSELKKTVSQKARWTKVNSWLYGGSKHFRISSSRSDGNVILVRVEKELLGVGTHGAHSIASKTWNIRVFFCAVGNEWVFLSQQGKLKQLSAAEFHKIRG